MPSPVELQKYEPLIGRQPIPGIEPADVPRSRVLICGGKAAGDVIVWEHEVAAHRPYLPTLRKHTVCLRPPSRGHPTLQRTATDDHASSQWGLLIVPAGEACALCSDATVTLWNLSVSPAHLQRVMRAQAAASRPGRCVPRLRLATGIDDPVLRALVVTLHHALRAGRPVRRQFVESMAVAASAHLLDQHCGPRVVSGKDQLGDEDLARLNALLLSRSTDRCRIEEAARTLGISAPRLTRLLKARTGQSFPRYCLQLRLEHSFELLRLGQLNVTEAALETCFANVAHFSRVFSKHFGVPPSMIKP